MDKFFASLMIGVSALILIPFQAQAAEIRIIAKPANTPLMGLGTNPGHVTIAFYDDKGNLVSSRGFWPDGVRRSGTDDMGMGRDVTKGMFTTYCGWYGCGERRARISNARLNWLRDTVATQSGTGCKSYQALGKSLTSDQCNCVTFATRVWRVATAEQERFSNFDPTTLKTTLVFRNRETNNLYAYGGQTWN
jgi:hypothetical protein